MPIFNYPQLLSHAPSLAYRPLAVQYIHMMEVEYEQYIDQYEIVSLAGEGGQASVYLCRKNGQEFALKVFRFGSSHQHAFQRQVEILQRACHPNLVAMIDNRPRARYKIRYHDEEIRPVIVLELQEGDELFLYLSKTGKFTSELSRYYIRQLLAAIKYLHQIGITHRDLKPQNILFDFNFTLKLSDFGHSKEKTGQMNTNKVGTDGYRAPEIETGVYDGLKVDIFSAGVILFIMYTGAIPFLSTRINDQIYRQIRNNRFAQFWAVHQRNKPAGFFPDSFKRLINSMLSADPSQRPSLQELEQNQWLNGELPGSPALIAEMTSRAIRLGLRAYQRRTSQIIPANLQEMRRQIPHRSSIDLQDETTTKQDVLQCIYNSLSIQAQSLPEYSLKNVLYTTKDANLAVSWVHCFFFEEWKSNTVFLEDHVEDIRFVRYEVKHNLDDFQVQVRLDFQINNENETQLVLLGKLHRSPTGNVGIDWKKIQGNSYWLSSIIFHLNESFKSLI